MSQEDAITNRLIKNAKKLEHPDIQTEVPYNHYGSRGVVDIVVENNVRPTDDELERFIDNNELFDENFARDLLTETYLWVYEIKSESAVKSATGANEVLRQFNSHREYFFDGTDYKDSYTGVKWALAFELTEYTYNHIVENEPMYRSVYDQDDVWIEMWDGSYGNLGSPFKENGMMDWRDLDGLR